MTPRRMLTIAAILIVLVFLFASPTFLSEYWVMVIISILTMASLSFGFRFLFLCGRLTIGAIAFAGIGAYGAALIATKTDIPVLSNPWAAIFFGALVAGVIALPLGYIILRVPGIMFAILTMAVVELVRYTLIMWDDLTGGVGGVVGIPAPSFPGVGSFGIDQTPYLYLAIFLVGLSILVMYRLEKTRVGLSMFAMAQNDILARHVGMDTFKTRVLLFAVVGFFAGMIGAFQAHYWHFVSPAAYHLLAALLIKVCAVAGGVMSPLGPLVGAAVLVGTTEGLRAFREYAGLFFGFILIFVIFMLPGGLVTLPRALAVEWPRQIRALPKTFRRYWEDIRLRFAPGS